MFLRHQYLASSSSAILKLTTVYSHLAAKALDIQYTLPIPLPPPDLRMPNMKLVFDFDGTITQKDTISTLAQSAIRFQKEKRRDDTADDLDVAWAEVVKAYVDDLKAYQEGFAPAAGERRTVEDEAAYLEGSKGLEMASLERVGGCGVFAGLTREDLFGMGAEARRRGDVVIRRGFEDVVALAEREGWETGIISVNWSRAFIEGAIHPLKMSGEVVANEVNPDGTIGGPKCLGGRPLTSSSGKKEVLNSGSSGNHGSGSEATQQDGRTVYFGDSPTDLECVVLGGVVIASSEEDSPLITSLRRVGLAVPHVSDCPGDGRGQPKTYWARDFVEIEQSGVLGVSA